MHFPDWLLIGLISFASTTAARTAGFGGALIGVSLYTSIIPLSAAAPLMSLVGASNNAFALVQSRRSLTLRDVTRIAVMLVIAIPIGVYSIDYISETVLRALIGAVCIAFAIYRFIQLPLPKLENPRWGYFFGTLSGFLSGAVSVAGPPVVIYAETQDWEPNRFRNNLFAVFCLSSVVNIISRFIAGQYTTGIVRFYLASIPFLLVGQLLGFTLAERINRDLFRKLILILILAIGVRILWGLR